MVKTIWFQRCKAYLRGEPESLVELKENLGIASLGHSKYGNPIQILTDHFDAIDGLDFPIREGWLEDYITVLQDANAERAQNMISRNCHATGRVHRDVIFAIFDECDGLV